MTERVKKLVDWFSKHPNEIPQCGIFNTPNCVADPTVMIYADGNVRVWACHYWDYIEILGLSEEEFSDACKELGQLEYELEHPGFDEYDDDRI